MKAFSPTRICHSERSEESRALILPQTTRERFFTPLKRGFRMTLNEMLLLSLSCFVFTCLSFAQFSPGELSRAHQQLEGTDNCTQCHEVGQTISGAKCLSCHTEIKKQFDLKRGFHFSESSKQCVDCHKDHLGRDAKTMQFDERTFVHTKTGFTLSGKHEKIKCEQCHATKNIKDEDVKKQWAEFPHKTFLGLSQSCASCHEDTHKGRFKNECSACHTTSAWKPASKFNHATVAFKLEGEHGKVECSKCHSSLSSKKNLTDFMTKSFADCTPCHATPHGEKFSGKDCKSCHSTQGWRTAMKKSFDHNLTTFQLVGLHETVKCEKCHQPNKKKAKSLRIVHERCTDCHSDKHNGEFLARYKNDCKICHDENGFKPSTFTLTKHNESKFKLDGSHAAVLCASCHLKKEKQLTFHFENQKCNACHSDTHRGEFKNVMLNDGCATCHATERWNTVSFNHALTKFSLDGKHAMVKCSACHKQLLQESQTKDFAKLKIECESCHQDIHQKQFASDETTNCSSCHKSDGWKMFVFNHETQSTFSLKGAHKKTECRSCHRVEESGGVKFVRFKPMASQCESCHQKRSDD